MSLVKRRLPLPRCILFALVLLCMPVLGSAQCLTTLAPNPPFVPPPPYLSDPPHNMFWLGSDDLWTALSVNAKWKTGDKNTLSAKLTFWRRGFDWRKETEPKLIVTGKRLDGDGPSVAVADAHAVFIPSRDAAGIMTGISIPTSGCWEITAHYAGHRLAFVVSVEP